ncbi:hypothetical protein [Francisella philomiragia]|uniref:hypothetical protein n=1 Tax=Francisella philomiragia TaxID=28110 RepID=UPI002242DBD8|nr:hypothetical protein [Francisella philomiragia]
MFNWLKKKKVKKTIDSNTSLIDFGEILRPKTKDEKKQILNVTAMSQLLLQSNLDAYESRDLGIQSGLIQEGMTDFEAIACPLAYYIFSGYEEKYSPFLATKFLLNYCKEEILIEFVHFYTQFAKLDPEKFIQGMKEYRHDAIMDIEAVAKMGTKLGLKKSTPNPYNENYSKIWNKSFI